MAWITKYQRDGGVSYRVGWRDPDGKTHLRTFRKHADATAFVHSVEGDKQRGEYVDPTRGRMTFGAYFVDEYLPNATHLKPSTRSFYKNMAERHLVPHFGPRPLATIATSDVKGFLGKLEKRVGVPTVRASYRLLRRILTSAVEDGRIGKNPASSVKVPAELKREHRILDHSEIQALATTIDPKYRALVYLMAYGGLRIGEAAALRVTDVDFLRARVTIARNSVEVDGQLIEGTPKGGSARTIPVPRLVIEELSRHLAEFGPGSEGRMFASDHGGPVRQSRFRTKAFGPAAKVAGLEGTRVHDLRHSAVAHAISVGAHPRAIMELAGHKSITMTLDTYGALFPGLADGIAVKVDELARMTAVPQTGA